MMYQSCLKVVVPLFLMWKADLPCCWRQADVNDVTKSRAFKPLARGRWRFVFAWNFCFHVNTQQLCRIFSFTFRMWLRNASPVENAKRPEFIGNQKNSSLTAEATPSNSNRRRGSGRELSLPLRHLHFWNSLLEEYAMWVAQTFFHHSYCTYIGWL